MNWPIAIYSSNGELIDQCGNVDSAVSVLYGDLSTHDRSARRIVCPASMAKELEYNARINADCWSIPLDTVETV